MCPRKETFKFEAVNDVIDAAEYPDVQRSVEIETNGAGTYQGTLTITGPAVQVQNFLLVEAFMSAKCKAMISAGHIPIKSTMSHLT